MSLLLIWALLLLKTKKCFSYSVLNSNAQIGSYHLFCFPLYSHCQNQCSPFFLKVILWRVWCSRFQRQKRRKRWRGLHEKSRQLQPEGQERIWSTQWNVSLCSWFNRFCYTVFVLLAYGHCSLQRYLFWGKERRQGSMELGFCWRGYKVGEM